MCPLPNLGMDFTPFDTLPAASLDDLVENIEALAAGTGLNVSAVTPEKILTGTGTTWAWTAYTPTVTLVTGGTNGNATITGGYKQIGKTVNYWIKYVIGGTTSFAGTTAIHYSVPVTMSAAFASITSIGFSTGGAILGGSNYQLTNLTVNSTTLRLCALNTSSSYSTFFDVNSAIPGAWATGHSWFMAGTYEAA